MTEKVLVIAPRIPDAAGSGRDRRFFGIVRALAGAYEVHFLFIQSLFTAGSARQNLEGLGVRVASLRDIRQARASAVVGQLRGVFNGDDYAVILFDTHYTAKYYMPELLAAYPRAITAINAARSPYVSDLCLAARCTPSEKGAALKSAEQNKMKEIPLYHYADIVIVDDPLSRDMLSGDIPHGEVVVISQPGNDDEGERMTTRETLAAFARRSRKKVREPKECPLDVAVVATGPARPDPAGRANDIIAGREPIVVEASGSLAAAYNAGLKRIEKEYGLLLPAGAVLPAVSLERMLVCLNSHPDIGIVFPASNLSLGDVADAEYLENFMPKHISAHFGNWHEVKNASEYCFLVRRRLLETTGFLDSRFVSLPYALFDWCLRAFQGGWRAIVNNEAFVYYRDFPVLSERVLADDGKRVVSKWCDEGNEFLEGIDRYHAQP